MIIQVFLTVLLAGVALLVAAGGATSRLLRLLVIGVAALGIWLVWSPDLTTRIAEFFGVGRGADLILYLWVVITLALIVFLFLKLERLSRNVTKLARLIALADAKRQDAERTPDESA